MVTQQQLKQLISDFQATLPPLPFSVADAVQSCEQQGTALKIALALPYIALQDIETLQCAITETLKRDFAYAQVFWEILYDIPVTRPINQQAKIKGVRNIIAVASAKGGVGKSSITVNLALAFAHYGLKVGVLDADIYGPSLPAMLGTEGEQPVSLDGQFMQPVMKYDLASHSIGYLLQDEDAVMWRGPMASKALLQILNDTLWPDLDYLFIDMPPGTGDIQLTLAKNIPVSGVVVVTTPQKIAWLDTLRGMMMLRKLDIPILGLVENMSEYICSECGTHDTIFGASQIAEKAVQYDTKLLGQLPLHRFYREDLDAGCPTVVQRPNSELTGYYLTLAQQVSAALYQVPQPSNDAIMIKMVE